jgi:hypothetical protein
VLLNDSALHFHPRFSFKNANQKRFTQSPVQDSILLYKCKTRGNASESRKGCEGGVGVKQITPTPLYMSSREFCCSVVVLMENSFCSYTKQR